MTRLPFRFTMVLLACLGTALAVHFLILHAFEKPLFNDLILLSYLVNFLLALGIFLGLYFLREKVKNALGFLFMAGSLLKFLVFFLIFYPTYKADGNMQSSEFAAFFAPYLIALVLETLFASKMLNKMGHTSE